MQKWTKDQLVEFLVAPLQSCSYTYIDVGNYYAVYTLPNMFMNSLNVIISIDKNEFGVSASTKQDELQKAVLDEGFKRIVETFLTSNEYWVEVKNNSLYLLSI